MQANKFSNIFFLCFLFLIGNSAIAQYKPKKSPEEKAGKKTEWMQKHLGLTQAQSRKVYDIFLYYAKEDDKANWEARGPEKKMEKKEIKRDRESELKEVLSTEQYAQYQMHEEEEKQRKREKKEGWVY